METNGFSFDGTDAGGMDYALNRAISAWYNDRAWWHALQARGPVGFCRVVVTLLVTCLLSARHAVAARAATVAVGYLPPAIRAVCMLLTGRCVAPSCFRV